MTADLADAPVLVPQVARRRRSRLSVGLLLVAVLLLATAGVRAAPSTVRLAPVAVALAGPAQAATLDTYGGPHGMDVVGYDDGATSELTLTLHNTGPLPLTVRALTLTRDVAPLLEVQSVTGLPLRLGPGGSGRVRATAVLGNCRYYHEREVSLYRTVELAWSVLGQARTTVVPLYRPILVHSPMIVGCPDRKLNRQADNRIDVLDAA